MNEPRIASATAFFLASILIGGSTSAQGFDTTPQYEAYSPAAQTVPKVNLPKIQTSGSLPMATSIPSPSSISSSPTVGSFPSSGTTAQPTRRTDAGAIRRDREEKKREPTVSTGTPPAAPVEQKYAEGMVIEGRATVYDGQNLVVNGVSIRLDGAEAPAISQQCMTRQSLVWNCGTRAKNRLMELAQGKKVRCTVTEPLGTGAAAICSITGISDLGAAMIRDGWAVANGHDKGRYAAHQMTAKAGKFGIWIGPFEAPWTYRARYGQ
jgi:Micrococcal nuclease (thermonuclease) homologs